MFRKAVHLDPKNARALTSLAELQILMGKPVDAEKSYKALRLRPPVENYEIAYASAIMAAPDEEGISFLWFGDCAALLRANDGAFRLFGETMHRKESERARVERLVKPGRPGPAAAGVRQEFLPVLRASRNYVNTAEEWLFAPDAACADHAKEARILVAPDSLLLLASDGFLALASDYERYTPEALFEAAQTQGLAALGQELRAVETVDPDGTRFPRFKRSDDATAILLAVRS